MLFGDGVGVSLVPGPYWSQLDVGLCDVDVFLHWNSAAEEGAWVGLKPDLQGGTGFNMLGSSFGPACKGNMFRKGFRKWTGLKSKVVPPGGSSFGPLFGPFIVANLLRRLFQVELILSATAASGILNWGGPFVRACFFLRFEVQKRDPSLSFCFAPISIALRSSRPASKPAPRCFILVSNSRDIGLRDLHWGLPPALFHSIIFCFAAISTALRPCPFAPAAA